MLFIILFKVQILIPGVINIKISKINKKIITGAYATQAISQPDSREEGSNIAIPSDENVKYNKHFVDENKK